jgi:hypothetical protein
MFCGKSIKMSNIKTVQRDLVRMKPEVLFFYRKRNNTYLKDVNIIATTLKHTKTTIKTFFKYRNTMNTSRHLT